MTRVGLIAEFSNRYASHRNQTALSNKLLSLNINDSRRKDDDEALAFDRIISRIASYTPLALPADQPDDVNSTFLQQAVIKTQWAFMATVPETFSYR